LPCGKCESVLDADRNHLCIEGLREGTRTTARPPAKEHSMTLKLAYSRKEACETLSIGTTKLHELINSKTLETFKIGRKTLVKGESLRRFAGEA
jgi:excisionase family DNA binding protein